MRRSSGAGDIVISVPGFALRVLGSSMALSNGAQYRVETSRGADELLHVKVSAKAEDLRASLFELDYDPKKYMPDSGEHGDWPGIKAEPLRLAVMDQPGTVFYGAVLPHPNSTSGASGDFTIFDIAFRDLDASAGFIPGGGISASPQLSAQGQLAGDYNQDGFVGLDDLLALADLGGDKALAGLGSIEGNFLCSSTPGANGLAVAGESQVDKQQPAMQDAPAAPLLQLSIPALPDEDAEALRAPAMPEPSYAPPAVQQPTAPQMPAALMPPGRNNWPSDKRERKWLSSVYLNLPAINSDFGVYGNAEQQQCAAKVFEETNYYRTNKTKLPELRRDPHLDAIAQAQAMHLAMNHYFEHNTPDGLTPFDRIDSADAPHWWAAGENIAAGQPTPDNVVKTWMNSKGHKKNIRSQDYQYIGIGAYYDPHTDFGWFWVQVFASFDGNPDEHDWIEPGEQMP